MNTNRRGEVGPIPFRRGRFYSIDRQWYATTREGEEIGPYPTEGEARLGVASHIADHLSEEEAEALAMVSTRDLVDLAVNEIKRFKQKLDEADVATALQWARERIERIMGEDAPYKQRKERVDALEFMLMRF